MVVCTVGLDRALLAAAAAVAAAAAAAAACCCVAASTDTSTWHLVAAVRGDDPPPAPEQPILWRWSYIGTRRVTTIQYHPPCQPGFASKYNKCTARF